MTTMVQSMGNLLKACFLRSITQARRGRFHENGGRIEPTVDLLWKIANALDVRISALHSPGSMPEFALFRASETRRFTSRDGGFQPRVLSPSASGSPVEFYGITLAPGAQ